MEDKFERSARPWYIHIVFHVDVFPKPVGRVGRSICWKELFGLDQGHGSAVGAVVISTVFIVSAFTNYLETWLWFLLVNAGENALISIREMVGLNVGKALVFVVSTQFNEPGSEELNLPTHIQASPHTLFIERAKPRTQNFNHFSKIFLLLLIKVIVSIDFLNYFYDPRIHSSSYHI